MAGQWATAAQLVAISGTVNSQTRNQAFSYDNVGRLATVSGWSAGGRRYGYDRWGNRTAMRDATVGGTQLQNVIISTIASVNGISYSHDASGNLTNDGSHTYPYDGAMAAFIRVLGCDMNKNSRQALGRNNHRH